MESRYVPGETSWTLSITLFTESKAATLADDVPLPD
jgi:hypothetical protein